MNTDTTAPNHISVMTDTVIEWLRPQADAWYLDATLGAGGHTQALLDRGACVVALDFDQAAINTAQRTFETAIKQQRLKLLRLNFALAAESPELRQLELAGAIFDLGTSSDQLTSSSRGFSFSGTGPLDMRLDDRLGVTAADLLAILDPKQLTQLFVEYGGESHHIARQVATEIVNSRQHQPLTTIDQLVEIVRHHKPNKPGSLHPATKIFQALRIAVNTELENLAQGLPNTLQLLQPQARMVVISFHDGEDRIVKHWMRQAEQQHLGHMASKKPLTPTTSELERNPRSRSAKLRIFEKR